MLNVPDQKHWCPTLSMLGTVNIQTYLTDKQDNPVVFTYINSNKLVKRKSTELQHYIAKKITEKP